MHSIRTIPVILILLLLFACTEQKQQKKTLLDQEELEQELVEVSEVKEEVIEIPEPTQNKTLYAELDSTLRQDLQRLDTAYQSTPFYVKLNGKNYYVTSSTLYDYPKARYEGSFQFGLANDSLQTLLEPHYDKIYNPNLVIVNCFEIAKNSQIGLVNYLTGEVLSPQFDYILPSSNEPNETAFGLKNGQWFKIESSDVSNPIETDFDPAPILRNLSFDIKNIGENMMYYSYWQYFEDDANEGRGIILLPSYVSYMKLLERDFTDIILPDQQGRIDFGTTDAKLTTSYRRKLSEKLVAFFVSAYESGIGARGYEQDVKKLVIHNQNTNALHTTRLGALGISDYFCRTAGYRFVNDSIVEVESNRYSYRGKNQRYDFETVFTYHKIEADGTLQELKSNRYYDFTKFILMNENNLKGCFAWTIQDRSIDNEHNMWITDHLSIEDLDIMRNEIFAEYGYKFKTEKWQKYFSAQPWYNPRYDDVNDLLTEIDKANVELILNVKKQMQEDEDGFRNKRTTKYIAAG